jgi:hypothetical protein
VIRTVPPQPIRSGVTLVSTTFAGVTTSACPVAGRIVAEPGYAAWMIRDEPAGSVADQLPSPLS